MCKDEKVPQYYFLSLSFQVPNVLIFSVSCVEGKELSGEVCWGVSLNNKAKDTRTTSIWRKAPKALPYLIQKAKEQSLPKWQESLAPDTQKIPSGYVLCTHIKTCVPVPPPQGAARGTRSYARQLAHVVWRIRAQSTWEKGRVKDDLVLSPLSHRKPSSIKWVWSWVAAAAPASSPELYPSNY